MVLTAGCSTGGLFTNQGADVPQFREVGAEAGFNYTASRTASFGNGRAGVYVTDFDNDRHPDVLAIGGERPVLFRNTGGAFEPAGVLPPLEITVKGALFFDYDNDGWEDLLLLPVNGSAVFLENQDGRFHRRDVGLGTPLQIAIGAAAADYNHDGCLDLFVLQSGDWRSGLPRAAMHSQARKEPVVNDTGNPNLLFAGNCSSFERVTDGGITGNRWSLATSFVDVTGDGWPDIHVGNDFNTDVLYVNQRNGTFQRVALPETDRHAMASEVADLTGDERLDVFVTNIHFQKRIWAFENMRNVDTRGNNLLVNRGNGTFTSEERAYGVRDGGWGWAASVVDLDNDGDRDLVHTTKSYLYDTNDDGALEEIQTRPRIWERTGPNFTRLNASRVGLQTASGRGLAHLDYDRDGDQDLVVAVHDGAFTLYENRGEGGNWLQVTLDGDGSPTLGARVYVTAGNSTAFRVADAETGFLSQESRILHLGLGDTETATVRVVWPDGSERTVEDVAANQRLIVNRTDAAEAEGAPAE